MKILVTGGAGFIGSHIVDKYIGLGYQVVVIDNLLAGFRKNLNKRAKFYKADIRNLPLMEKILRKEKPQIINHHAAISEVIKSIKDPHLTYETNVLGTANILLAGSAVGIKKFLFSSTGDALYNNQKRLPVGESFLPNAISPYGFSKLIGEKFVEFYAKQGGFQYLIFRYANVYGLRQNRRIISIFTGLRKRGVRPTIFGDGTKTRDYIYIDDIIRVNILGLKIGKNEVLNIGSGHETSDQKVFDVLAQELNFKKLPIYTHFRQGEVYRIALDCFRARKTLKWQLKVNFKEG